MNDSIALRFVQLKEQITELVSQASEMSDVERFLKTAILQVEVNDLQIAVLKEGLQILQKAESYVDSNNDDGIAVCKKLIENNQETGRCLSAIQEHLDYFRKTGTALPEAAQLN